MGHRRHPRCSVARHHPQRHTNRADCQLRCAGWRGAGVRYPPQGQRWHGYNHGRHENQRRLRAGRRRAQAILDNRGIRERLHLRHRPAAEQHQRRGRWLVDCGGARCHPCGPAGEHADGQRAHRRRQRGPPRAGWRNARGGGFAASVEGGHRGEQRHPHRDGPRQRRHPVDSHPPRGPGHQLRGDVRRHLLRRGWHALRRRPILAGDGESHHPQHHGPCLRAARPECT